MAHGLNDAQGSQPNAPVPTLIAGDRFVLNRLLTDALDAAVPTPLDYRFAEFDWPVEPFGPVAEVHEAIGTEEQMIGLVSGVAIVVTEMAAMTERVIAAAEALRLIVVCRGGPVNVNLAAATARGIPVCYTPARNAAATAEYTIGLILAALRHIPHGHADLVRGVWRGDFYAYEDAGTELDGATVGLIGFGAVGRRVTRVLRACEAEVLVADPYVAAEDVADAGGRLVSLDALLAQSRVVSLHARLTPETHHLMNRARIAQLPVGAVLVNSARGGLLDYDALCDALDAGHLRAAALDVYDPEPPPPGSRLFTTRGLVLSPHIAGATRETAERAATIAAAEASRFLRGDPLLNVANRAALAAS